MSKAKRIFLSGLFLTSLLVFTELTLLVVSKIKTISSSDQILKNKRIVLAYGESTTQMGGEDSWPSQLERKLNSLKTPNKFTVINRGGVGITTVTILKTIQNDLKKIKPEFVVTMMGINEENLTGEYELIKRDHDVFLLGGSRVFRLISWAWYRLSTWSSLNLFKNDFLLEKLWEDGEIDIVVNYLKKEMNTETCEGERYGLALVERYIELKELVKAFSILGKDNLCEENEKLKNYIHASALIYKFSENNTLEKIYDNAFYRPSRFLGELRFIDESLDTQIEYYKEVLSSLKVDGLKWRFFKRGFYSDLEESDLVVLLGVLFLEKGNYKVAKDYLFEALEKIKFKQREGWIDHSSFVYLLLFDIEKKINGEKQSFYFKKAMENLLVRKTIEKRKTFKVSQVLKTGFSLTPLYKAKDLLEKLKSNKNTAGFQADVLNILSEVYFILGYKNESLDSLNTLKKLSIPRSNLVLLPRLLNIIGESKRALEEIEYIKRIPGIDKEPFLREELFILKELKISEKRIKEINILLDSLNESNPNIKTTKNYIKVNSAIQKSGAFHIVMQYPLRSIDEIKRSLKGSSKTIFIENDENFSKKVSDFGYDHLFIDRFASDFGHCTKEGNELIAENVKNHIEKMLKLK